MAASSPWTLGIASSHNGGACLLHDDEIVVAIQEERLVRTKRAEHPGARPSMAIAYCLEYASIEAKELAAIVLSTWRDHRAASEDLTANPLLRPNLHGVPVFAVGHHLAHAFGAFATSGFDRAAVLVVDGNGSPWANLEGDERRSVRPSQVKRFRETPPESLVETVSIYRASERRLQAVEKHVAEARSGAGPGMRPFWSLGHMYAAVGAQIFGGGLDGAGKVMGLAPYGTPTWPPGDFFDLEDGDFVFRDSIPALFRHGARWPNRREKYANLAASVQGAIEKAVLYLAQHARTATGESRLCYAGGVALNSVANERVVREAGFDDVYIMPAAEDSGTSIGAAFYGLWRRTGSCRGRRVNRDSMGRTYGSEDVDAALARTPLVAWTRSSDVVGATVDALRDGAVVGWFQGGSELGPRSLGQRSLLADPRRADMKDRLNGQVKFREGFRPFAPVVLAEAVHEWFDVQAGPADSPFMLRVMPVREGKRALVPAVVHVDGTGRVQTVTADNGLLYDLLRRFADATGVPILLNTSFNTAGEPIVETPDDALVCFQWTGIDLCVLGDRLVRKASPSSSLMDLYVRSTVEWLSLHYPAAAGAAVGAAHDEDDRLAEAIGTRHAGGAIDLDHLAETHPIRHARLLTRTRWGRLLTVTRVNVADLLARADGTRTARELLAALPTGAGYTSESFRRVLIALHRVSAVTFHLEPAVRAKPLVSPDSAVPGRT